MAVSASVASGNCHTPAEGASATNDTDPFTVSLVDWALAPPRGLGVVGSTPVVSGDCFAPAEGASARNDLPRVIPA